MSLNKKVAGIVLLILVALNIFIWRTTLTARANTLHVHFFDVGQGDAIYIRTPANQDILVDGGPDSSVLAKLGQAMPFYDRKIELMILTHPHADHVDGLVDVLQRYEVEQVLYTGVEYKSATYDEWQKLITAKNISAKIAVAGQVIQLGSAQLNILFPTQNFTGKTIKELNNSSVVGHLTYDASSVLLTGDAEKEVEKSLLEKLPSGQLKSNIFKAGHHGSDTSNTKSFIQAVDPEIAVISVGEKNKYKHPAPSTLETFTDSGIRVFRTDQDGDIRCWLDGKEFGCINN